MSAVPPLAEPDSSGSPALIGDRFEVLAVLGRGGMGTVYRVRDRANDRLLALKRVSFVARPTLRTLFEREYTTLARLNHPLVIDVYDYALEGDGAAYYTMELLDGDDLSRLAPLPYPLACRYLRQVATMLALLHARHLVHRDLSPRNVRITERDACKLLDFGALAAFGEAGAVIGTAPCVPPEAFDHEALDQRVDLYGLGCLAYFALTGRHAYPASQVEQLPSYWAQAIDPPSTLVADRQANDRTLPAIPKELDEWVLSLLHLDRSARPTSAGAALDRLNVILGEGARDEFEQAASYLASAPTIGRELQLDAAKHWTDQALRGRGQVLVFEGTAGAGKTHLLQEIALAARLRGPSVVTVDASASDRPFGTARALCRGLFEVAGIAALDAARPHAEWLAAIAPALGGALPNEAPARDAAWNDEAQAALLDFIIELSRRTPLVLSIDNFHVCDQPSAALIAMLGREAKQLPLSLMATVRPDENSPYTRALRMNGEVFGLDRLNSSQLATWLGALFGRDTPNLPRLCQFVHAETGGQPGDAIELLYALLHAKQIRYTDGSWVLPLSPAEAALPSTAEASLLLRLQNLNGDARRLAGALCLYRGRLTRELCHTLSQLDATSLQLALRELLDARILVQQRDTYAFAHDAIREALRAQVPDGERGTLQRRIADVILSRETLRVEEKLDAGLHLFEAGDPRGIRLLCRSGVTLSQRPQNIASCTPILERALALAKARGRGRLELVCLLAPLAVSAYAADRRLDRYAGELSECFDHLLGLSIARKLRPFIGKHLSSYVGLIAGAIRHRLTPASQRHAHFLSIVPMLIASIMALCGRAAICLDRSQIDKHMALLEPLTVFGRTNPIQFAYDYCRALSLVTQDRHSKTYELCLDLEQRLSTPAIMRHVGAEARRFWQGGLHYLLGLFESFSSDPRVLARCEQLEQSAFSVERLIAAQLRRLYHTFRGEA
ncbi:MAG TPA: protein kinase, partial [Polyangiales bacterium]